MAVLRSVSYAFWNMRGFCATDVKLHNKKKKWVGKALGRLRPDIFGCQEGNARDSDEAMLKRMARRHHRLLYVLPGRITGEVKDRISLGGFLLVKKSFKRHYHIRHHILIPHYAHALELVSKRNNHSVLWMADIYLDSRTNATRDAQIEELSRQFQKHRVGMEGRLEFLGGDFNFATQQGDRFTQDEDGEGGRLTGDRALSAISSRAWEAQILQRYSIKEVFQPFATVHNNRTSSRIDRLYVMATEVCVLVKEFDLAVALRYHDCEDWPETSPPVQEFPHHWHASPGLCG